MKQAFFFVFCIGLYSASIAQVGINQSNPTSTLDINGSVTNKVSIITTSTTLNDTYNNILCNNTGSINVTLPTANSIGGRSYIIKSINTGTVNILTTGSQTIDGASSINMNNQYDIITLVSNGSNWNILSTNFKRTLKLSENPSNGTDYVTIQSPSNLSAGYTLTLPPNDGTSGQSLLTNGTGTLSWGSASASAQYSYRGVSSNTTLTSTDEIVGVNANSGSVTITLPLANSVSAGKFYIIDCTGSSNSIIVSRSGSNTIGGSTSATLSCALSSNNGAIFYSDGTSTWYRVP